MSEYQCYDFVAIDRPLTSKEMAELRQLSTRADISPTRFWNEYQWGDFKADPAKLVERYFDAHLYFASWGTSRLMLRVPAEHVDVKQLRTYFAGDGVSARISGDHVIVDIHIDDEDPSYDGPDRDSLAALAPLRAELMRGDLRAAYLAWLLSVQSDDIDNESIEPAVPHGLSQLTEAQEALVEFFKIDDDLIAAAAEASAAICDERPALLKWVLAQPPRTKDEWLRRAVDVPDLALGGELIRTFRAEAAPATSPGRRTVAELLASAEKACARRERAERARSEKEKNAAEAKRNQELDSVAKRGDDAWAELESLIERSAYDDALKLAIDLRDLAQRDEQSTSFNTRFDTLRKRVIRRRGFIDRWKRANSDGR
jgi:hypothetical protein